MMDVVCMVGLRDCTARIAEMALGSGGGGGEEEEEGEGGEECMI